MQTRLRANTQVRADRVGKGILDFPASLIASALWQGLGRWSGFGHSALCLFGSAMALVAAVTMAVVRPGEKAATGSA